MVLAGIECSQKSLIFANGIPVQESVEFFDTLKQGLLNCSPCLSIVKEILNLIHKTLSLIIIAFAGFAVKLAQLFLLLLSKVLRNLYGYFNIFVALTGIIKALYSLSAQLKFIPRLCALVNCKFNLAVKGRYGDFRT